MEMDPRHGVLTCYEAEAPRECESRVVLTHLGAVLLGAWRRNAMMGTCWMEMAAPGSVRRKKASTVSVSLSRFEIPLLGRNQNSELLSLPS